MTIMPIVEISPSLYFFLTRAQLLTYTLNNSVEIKTERGIMSISTAEPIGSNSTDRDRFLQESFEVIAKFFAQALADAERMNAKTNLLLRILNTPILRLHRSVKVQTHFQRMDEQRFVASIDVGRIMNQCDVGISQGNDGENNLYIYNSSYDPQLGNRNHSVQLTVTEDQGDFLLKSSHSSVGSHALTPKKAAKYFWDIFRNR